MSDRKQQSSRRAFLTQAALGGGALVLPSAALMTPLTMLSSCSSKSRRTPHYFVFYFMVGGWDLMLGTDPVPRQDGFFVPFEDDEIVTAGGHRFGPAFGPLLPFASKIAVLRGIHCDALNHPQARFRMVTGRFKPPGNVVTSPSVQTLLAKKLGQSYEMPNLSSDALRPASFRGLDDDPLLEPVRVASLEQLQGIVGVRGDIADYADEIHKAVAAKDAITRDAYDGIDLAADFGQFADLARALAKSDYRARARSAQPVDDKNKKNKKTLDKWQRQARMAVEAIRLDLAPVITVGSGEFDSHTRGEYMSHVSAVERGFRTVAEIAKGLADSIEPDGSSMLDHTTIVVTSEFSRSPSRNELGGKHHWPTNAMVLLGKGVRTKKGGPYVVGEVDDNLKHVPMNPKTGSSAVGAEDISMSHALSTVLALAGIDGVPLLEAEPVRKLLA